MNEGTAAGAGRGVTPCVGFGGFIGSLVTGRGAGLRGLLPAGLSKGDGGLTVGVLVCHGDILFSVAAARAL